MSDTLGRMVAMLGWTGLVGLCVSILLIVVGIDWLAVVVGVGSIICLLGAGVGADIGLHLDGDVGGD